MGCIRCEVQYIKEKTLKIYSWDIDVESGGRAVIYSVGKRCIHVPILHAHAHNSYSIADFPSQ
jgi:hypothetical protein